MRDPREQELALECLRLVFEPNNFRVQEAIDAAERCFAFVTGTDVDDAKAKLAAVLETVTGS